MTELRIDLLTKSDSNPVPFESMPNFPKDRYYLIAGTYKQKVGDEVMEIELYYQIISDEDGSIRLGPLTYEIPNDLLYTRNGSGINTF